MENGFNFFEIPKVEFDEKLMLKTLFDKDGLTLETVNWDELKLFYTLPDIVLFLKNFIVSYKKFEQLLSLEDINKATKINVNENTTTFVPVIVKTIKIDLNAIVKQNLKFYIEKKKNSEIILKDMKLVNELIKEVDKKERELRLVREPS